jgi:hypothetical protein
MELSKHGQSIDEGGGFLHCFQMAARPSAKFLLNDFRYKCFKNYFILPWRKNVVMGKFILHECRKVENKKKTTKLQMQENRYEIDILFTISKLPSA